MTKILSLVARFLLIRLIRFYQKYISPHKGFCCAYHKHTGGRSCSGFALVVVRRYGVSALWRSFPKRLDDCKMVAIRLNEEEKNKTHPCEYCETLEVCSWVDCTPSCEPNCDMPDICSCNGCDCDGGIKHKVGRWQISFSPFFLLFWMYKISNKRREKALKQG